MPADDKMALYKSGITRFAQQDFPTSIDITPHHVGIELRVKLDPPDRSPQPKGVIAVELRCPDPQRALWKLEERATAEAYQRQPDSVDDAYVDSRV